MFPCNIRQPTNFVGNQDGRFRMKNWQFFICKTPVSHERHGYIIDGTPPLPWLPGPRPLAYHRFEDGPGTDRVVAGWWLDTLQICIHEPTHPSMMPCLCTAALASILPTYCLQAYIIFHSCTRHACFEASATGNLLPFDYCFHWIPLSCCQCPCHVGKVYLHMDR